MSDRGLVEVPNPSALFLADRANAEAEPGEEGGKTAGAAVFAGIEGTRPLLVEVQALVAPSLLGTPRRAVVGWDATRLAMITAVLDARCGLSVGANDIYLNIAGGLRIVEPAADLAVAAALVSALTETPVPADTVVFGEIGLSGRVRPVAHAEARLKEAAKLGFAEAWVPLRPPGRTRAAPRGGEGLATVPIGHLSELVARLPPAPRRRGQPSGSRRFATAPYAMNPLDLGVIGIVALSAIFAFARGFVREALSIVAWAGAGAITLYGFNWVYAQVEPRVHDRLLAQLSAGFGLFVVSLIVLTILTGIIARSVRASGLSPIDRTLGFIFGAGARRVSCLPRLSLARRQRPAERLAGMDPRREERALPARGGGCAEEPLARIAQDQERRSHRQRGQGGQPGDRGGACDARLDEPGPAAAPTPIRRRRRAIGRATRRSSTG